MKTLTINATVSQDEDGGPMVDFLAERGVDIELPENVDHRQIMALLFDGFTDRLKAAGIPFGDVTNFT